jgi:hypothetical protein
MPGWFFQPGSFLSRFVPLSSLFPLRAFALKKRFYNPKEQVLCHKDTKPPRRAYPRGYKLTSALQAYRFSYLSFVPLSLGG